MEAPASSRERISFKACTPDEAKAGGRDGSVWREAAEIYGVVLSYWAITSAGIGRQDLAIARRTLGLAFSIASMPFEFSQMVVDALHKRGRSGGASRPISVPGGLSLQQRGSSSHRRRPIAFSPARRSG